MKFYTRDNKEILFKNEYMRYESRKLYYDRIKGVTGRNVNGPVFVLKYDNEEILIPYEEYTRDIFINNLKEMVTRYRKESGEEVRFNGRKKVTIYFLIVLGALFIFSAFTFSRYAENTYASSGLYIGMFYGMCAIGVMLNLIAAGITIPTRVRTPLICIGVETIIVVCLVLAPIFSSNGGAIQNPDGSELNWKVTTDGTLIIGEEGKEQNLYRPDGGNFPWYHNQRIKNVRFAGVVKAHGSIGSMFEQCGLEKIDLNHFDTSDVTDMSRMFAYCESLNSIDVSMLEMKKVTDTSYMFEQCGELEDLDFYHCNTTNVKNMSGMFTRSGVRNVKSLSTQSAENMDFMFCQCRNLKSLDDSAFNAEKVTTMESMFSGSGIKEVDMSAWNTKSLANTKEMFYGCADLTSFKAYGIDTKKVTDMDGMFDGCKNLKELNLSSWDVSSVTNMDRMFANCANLSSLNTEGWKVDNVVGHWNVYEGCEKLPETDKITKLEKD